MKTTITNISPLINFAQKEEHREGLHGTSPTGRQYGRLVVETTANIPASPGFYIWGYYTSTRLWRTVYLGKAGFGVQTHLNARITEELKDERPCIWSHGKTKDEISIIQQQWLAPGLKAPDYQPQQASINHFNRSILKSPTTHIITVSDFSDIINNQSIRTIESDLIETMNPIANMQRPRPDSDLLHQTVEIIGAFKKIIHENR